MWEVEALELGIPSHLIHIRSIMAAGLAGDPAVSGTGAHVSYLCLDLE